MRPVRLVLLALVAIILTLVVVAWPWIDAQRRAVVAVSTTLDTPVLGWLVRVVTAEPQVEETVVAGNAATLVRPDGDGPWPAVVFVNGTTPEGRFQPEVQRLARGLARAGYLVLVPDLPGLARSEVTEAALRATTQVALLVSEREDVRDRRVALVGVSAGGSLALLAAADPQLAERVSVVAAFAPYAALANVIRLATTGFYQDDELKPYRADPLIGLAVARSLAALLQPGPDRERLSVALAPVNERTPDPLANVRALDESQFDVVGAAMLRLLKNTHPHIFSTLYSDLDAGVQAQIQMLSPLVRAADVKARVELLSSPRDKYFPLVESESLARALPDAELTVTPASGDHVIPRPSLAHPIGAWQFNAFVVRALKAAR